LEFTKGEVATLDSSHTFIAIETDTDMRLHDHTNVISTIANGQSNGLFIIFLNESYYISFLSRTHSATDDCFTSLSNLYKVLFEHNICKDHVQGLSFN
jgi:hypothetical protein